jgi:hypothetical protein
MLSKITVIAMAALLTIGILGCSAGNVSNPLQTESQVDKNWGRSFEAAKYNQTLNPDAEKNLKPVEGLQGPSAEKIMEGYTKGAFEEKKQSSSAGLGGLSIGK